MATFPSIEPDFGSTENSNPRVRSVQLGDGYVQRLSFGLNTDLKVWNLSWTNISDTDASTIEDFLEARKGSESFSWSPPDDSSTYKWICPEWQKQLTHGGVNKITAKFQEVADL
tara:strand:- start:36 stop:377 length:342 start_codon:yes stop_codon:yes gene_type:complete